MSFAPRLIRIGKAPAYLSMSRAVFDAEVRPLLQIIPIGRQGKAIDVRELDAWVDAKRAGKNYHQFDKPAAPGNDIAGNSGRAHSNRGNNLWREKPSRASSSVAAYGTSTSRSRAMDAFARALELATARKPKNS